MYRAKAVTQQDGSAHANSNCRLASAATGLDFDTLGRLTSTGKEMRARSGDPAGGTTASDAVRAWATYSETLHTQNGKPWSDVVVSLKAGHLVHLDVWAARCGGPCCKSAVGHTIAIAPERNSEGKWLVMDPWCKPAKWTWWPESRLRAGAEEWADRCGWRSRTLGYDRDIGKVQQAVLDRVVKELMTMWTPDHPLQPEDDDYEPATFGIMPTLWTRTDAHPDVEEDASDMAIRATGIVTSKHLLHCKKGLAWYADAAMTQKKGEFNSARELVYIGLPVGENSRAIIVNTGAFDSAGETEPVICYVNKDSVGSPYDAPPAPDNAARDKQWRDWLSKDANAPDKSTGATAGIEDDDGAPDGD